MGTGVLPVAAALLLFTTLVIPAISEDIYWEGEEDSSREFLEVNDNQHTGLFDTLKRVRRGFWDSFFTTSSTEAPAPIIENVTDDSDDLDGSGAPPDREIDPREKTLRVSFVVMEPYKKEYSNRDSEQFQNLSKSLADAVNLIYENIKGTQRASLVRIQSRPADEFSCKVTLDIVTSGNDDTDSITDILREHILGRRSLGNITINDADFSATVIDPSVEADCGTSDFMCDDRRCISMTSRCDKVVDCEDGTDENNCPDSEVFIPRETTTSTTTSTTTTTTTEIPWEQEYDVNTEDPFILEQKNNDVGDNQNCLETYECRNSLVSICDDKRCDGFRDCPEGDDETGCPYDQQTDDDTAACPRDSLTCDQTRCVPLSKRCDKQRDCYDGKDEENCEERCGVDDFRCYNGQCIENYRRCDKQRDCDNGEDELDCPCTLEEFQCGDGSCIELRKRCDQEVHCSDGSDEYDCQGRNKTTPWSGGHVCRDRGFFRCGDGTCLTMLLRCDGFVDCPNDKLDEHNCPCSVDEWQCDHGSCIKRSKRCDGRVDCPSDRSDERDCYELGLFTCWSGKKIPKSLRCNRQYDCPPGDFSDEKNCPCGKDDFKCDNGFCIPEWRKCDRTHDCQDGSDEKHCVYADALCMASQYACTNGECVVADARCNGTSECTDLSDEADCPCRRDQYRCSGGGACISIAALCNGYDDCPRGDDERNCDIKCFSCDGRCLDESLVCDNRQDCSDNSDELNCQHCDGPDDFRCQNGDCILSNLRCNNIEECPDGSDELGCNQTRIGVNGGCYEDEFQCSNGVCLSIGFRCDGHTDCTDGTDEENCPRQASARPLRASTAAACADDEFACYDGHCIPHDQRCDNLYDCRDFSDEQNCYHSACRMGQFQCTSGNCISNSLMCDGKRDCPDGSDELRCVTSGPVYTYPPTTTARPVYTTTSFPRLPTTNWGDGGRPYYPVPTQDACLAHEWRCENGPCIATSQRCDGRLDCPLDDSDELDCPAGTPAALKLIAVPESQSVRYGGDVVFQCRDEGPERAPTRWFREGGRPLKPGSTDVRGRLEMFKVSGSDSGVYVCQAPRFAGQPGSQLKVTLVVETRSTTNRPPVVACAAHEATCANGQCIPRSGLCNGKQDCADGSDEDSCNLSGHCEPNQHQCPDRRCILKTWVCDGERDCSDGSDEASCQTRVAGQICDTTEFACHTGGQCIPRSYHCDMQHDCLDRSDEVGCTSVHVTVPPRPNNLRLNRGDTLTLTCEAVGVPTPFVTWRLNWGHVPEKCTSTSVNGVGTLVCPDMEFNDSGAYSCEAMNNKMTSFAVPDAIVYVNKTEICQPGYFNNEARSPSECIRCFCFGESQECRSADLFKYNIPTPLGEGGTRLLGVKQPYNGDVQIDTQPITDLYYYQPLRNGATVTRLEVHAVRASKPYIALPETYNGNQLEAYGGSIRYRLQPQSDRITYDSNVPDIIVKGKFGTLMHFHRHQNQRQEFVEASFLPGNWKKPGPRGPVIATREDIMMALDKVETFLLRADLNGAGVNITDFNMQSAQTISTELGPANLVEECKCPPGYEGLSCQKCASGYTRSSSGHWLGSCVPDETPCPPGTYGSPSSGLGCRPCPCPFTNKDNQFANTCSLAPDGTVICDCLPGYEGPNCGRCSPGYTGNPMIPGDSCRVRPAVNCHAAGTLTIRLPDQCICKENVQGEFCDRCVDNTFSLSADFNKGCAKCFCSGVTDQCTSTYRRRKTTSVLFNSPRATDQVKVYKSVPAGAHAIRYNAPVRTEIASVLQSGGVALRTNDASPDTVYYWSLPVNFIGDKVTAYGGYLNYQLRNVVYNRMFQNNAPDVQLISENKLTFQFIGNFVPSSDGYLNGTVQLLENGWHRADGTDVAREHFLLALADVKAILIKASYNSHSDASLTSASIETAEQDGDGPQAIHVEECRCPVGYLGTSCENCAPGYTRSGMGLYLQTCVPCSDECNGNCHPETGECDDCPDNRAGDDCRDCKPGFELDQYGKCSPEPGGDCNRCDPRGVSGPCTDQCSCKANVEGPYCDVCRPGTFGLSADNPEGCLACYCSGVTNQCKEATHLTRLLIPAEILGENYGDFTLTDIDGQLVPKDQFIPDSNDSELTYSFSNDNRVPYRAQKELFWSLPKLPGNRITSYNGNLNLTQMFESDQDYETVLNTQVILFGDELTAYYDQGPRLRSGEKVAYQVPLRERDWRDSSGRPVSRNDFLKILRNLRRVLIRATADYELVSTSISEVSMDGIEYRPHIPGEPTKGVEFCSCPEGYKGTSCESCAEGFYKDRDQCVSCPCNGHPCHAGPYSRPVCQCRPPATGPDCSSQADITIPETTRLPPAYSTVVVTISGPMIKIQEVGGSVNFTCRAQSRVSKRPLTVFWSKTDGYLPQDRSFTTQDGRSLTITNLQPSDSGFYVCQATDGVSTEQARTSLQVPSNELRAPSVTIRRSYMEVYEGERIELECYATGLPTPRITWQRTNRALPVSSETYEGFYVIERATENDSGEYRCTAKNTAGMDHRTAVVTVRPNPSRPNRPQLSVTPASVTVAEGQGTRVVCSGTPTVQPASIEWVRQDGDELMENVESSRGVLYINDARLENQGVYVCKSSSPGVAPVPVLVNVNPLSTPPPQYAPKVTASQDRVIIPTGGSAIIDCTPSGYPTPTVRWAKYAGEFGPSTSQRDNSLVITNAQESDRGNYMCEGLIDGNTATNIYVVVDIERRETPRVEIWPPGEHYEQPGASFEFQCRLVAGEPQPGVTWSRKDARQLAPHVSILPNNVLKFENIEVNDEGEYVCTATNLAGEHSASAVLRVRSPPVITLSDSELTVSAGEPVTVDCRATGYPQPRVSIYQDTPRKRIMVPPAGGIASLRISSASPQDEGTYTCTAESPYGTINEQFYVGVEQSQLGYGPYGNEGSGYEPDENQIYDDNQPASLRVSEGQITTIVCNSSGDHDIQWTRENNKPLQSNAIREGNVLRIYDTSRNDAGIYECWHTDPDNGFSQQVIVTNLEVLRPLRITLRPPTQTVRPGQSPTVECVVEGDDYPQVIWRPLTRPYSSRVQVNGPLLVFNRIEVEDAGQYECFARNEIANTSATAEVIVNEEVSRRPLESHEHEQRAHVGATVTLSCDMRPQPRLRILWSKDGRPVPRNIKQKSDDSLYIRNAQKYDSGHYVCHIQDHGRVITNYVNLHIEDVPDSGPASLVMIDRPSRPFETGNNVQVRCTSRSRDIVNFKWIKVGTNEYVDHKPYGGGSMLNIQQVQTSDAGTYRCIGTDYNNQNYEDEFELQVVPGYEPQSQWSEGQVYNARKNSEITLPCYHNMPGPVSVTWRREYGQLAPDVVTNQPQLTLSNIRESDSGTYICTVSNGRERIEAQAVLRVVAVVPSFNGNSWLSLNSIKDSFNAFSVKISFKPTDPNGLILYNSHDQGREGDYLALQLLDGVPQVQLRTKHDSAPHVLMGDRPLELNTWHTVRLNWSSGSKLTMEVDDLSPFSKDTPWELLELNEPLYIGGVPDPNQLPSDLAGASGFMGCVSELILSESKKDLLRERLEAHNLEDCDTCSSNPCLNDGICQEASNSVGFVCMCREGFVGVDCGRVGEGCRPDLCGPGECIDTADGYKCSCHGNYTGPRCENAQSIEYPAFTGGAYLAIKIQDPGRMFELSLSVKPSQPLTDGVVMYCAESERGHGGFTSLAFVRGRLQFQYDLGDDHSVKLTSRKPLPAEWSKVVLKRRGYQVSMNINNYDVVNDTLTSLQAPVLRTPMFVGGYDSEMITLNKKVGVTDGFNGCIKELNLLNNHIDLSGPAVNSVHLQECKERNVERGDVQVYDDCSQCRNGGVCSSDGSSPCRCPSGFTGQYCEIRAPRDPCAAQPCQHGGTCGPPRTRNYNYSCDCPLGYSGVNCQMVLNVGSSVSFNGTGYMELPRWLVRYDQLHQEDAVIALGVQTRGDGVLFYQGELAEPDRGDYVLIRVENGRVLLEWNMGGDPTTISVDEINVVDGQRHRIIAKIKEDRRASLEVDGHHIDTESRGFSNVINIDSNIYIGGIPEALNVRRLPAMSGCFDQVELMSDGRGLDLGKVAIGGMNTQRCRDTLFPDVFPYFDEVDVYESPPRRAAAAAVSSHTLTHNTIITILTITLTRWES